MLDSFCHMTLKLFLRFCHIYTTLLWASFHNSTKICKSLVFDYQFENIGLLQPKMQRQVINEPVHEISNNVVCVTSRVSDQPAHTCSLIRAFASRLNILSILSY